MSLIEDPVECCFVNARNAAPDGTAESNPTGTHDSRWAQAVGLDYGASRPAEKAIGTDVVAREEAKGGGDDALLRACAGTFISTCCRGEQTKFLVRGRKMTAWPRLTEPDSQFDHTWILDIRFTRVQRLNLTQLGHLFSGYMNHRTARRPGSGHKRLFVPARWFTCYDDTREVMFGCELPDGADMGRNSRRRIGNAPIRICEADVAVQELLADVDGKNEMAESIDAGPHSSDLHDGAECTLECDWTHRKGSEAPSFCPDTQPNSMVLRTRGHRPGFGNG